MEIKQRKNQTTLRSDEPHFEMFEDTPVCHISTMFFYTKMVEQGKLDRVFFDGTMRNLQAFTKFVKEHTWFFFAYSGYEIVGAVWFTGFMKKSCKVHLCSFRGYKPREWITTGNELLDYILDNKSFMCYKIIARPPYPGMKRLFKAFGFVERNDQLERTK